MTHYYVNSVTGSDLNGGTSENDAWATLAQGYSSITGGDVLWVKGAGATYAEASNYNSSYLPWVTIEGYDSVTGDKCLNGIPPKIEGRLLSPGTRAYFSNFSCEYDQSGAFEAPVDFRRESVYENLTVYVSSSYVPGSRSTALNMGANNTNIRGFRFISKPSGYLLDSAYNTGVLSSGGNANRSSNRGCVYDCSNVSTTSGVSYISYQNSTNYGGFSEKGSVYMGNPSETSMSGIYYLYQTNANDFVVDTCVFYNLDKGIVFETDLADSQAVYDRIISRGNKFIIKNCFFINCNVGVEFESGIDFPVTVENCIFYNCTSYNVTSNGIENNSIYATQNPFDAENRRLNDYGKSLLNLNYHTGTENVTSDSRREIYQLPIGTKFTTTDTGSFDGSTGGVGDTLTVSGRSYQLIQDNPRVWRRV
jgi:hypothetical protein